MDPVTMESVFLRRLENARLRVAEAEAFVAAAQREAAEAQQRVQQAEAVADAARTRLAVVDEFVEDVRREAAEMGAASEQGSPPQSNGHGRAASMTSVMDEIMRDGKTRTATEIYDALISRGHTWSRQSVVNRCSERVREGLYLSVKRGSYKLAADSGDKLPSGPASPEGGREPQPESDSQLGAGQVQEAGSLAV